MHFRGFRYFMKSLTVLRGAERLALSFSAALAGCALSLSALAEPMPPASASAAAPAPGPEAHVPGPPGPAASAQGSPTGAATQDTESVGPEPPKIPEPVRRLRERTAQVRAFLRGELEVSIEPSSLFDVNIGDAEVVALEARRLASILEPEERDGRSAEPGVVKRPLDEKPGARVSPGERDAPDAGASSAPAQEPIDYAKLRQTDRELWEARLALDRARIDFYRLPSEQRQALLAKHAERQRAATTATDKALEKVDEEADKAEREKLAALEAARRARSEAERAVHEEYARLLTVTKQQANYAKKLIETRETIHRRHDEALGQRRESNELIGERRQTQVDAAVMDAAYVRLRQHLKRTRDQLASAVDLLASGTSRVPIVGEDPLTAVPDDIDRSRVDAERQKLEKRASELLAQERELLEQGARLAMADVEMLNRTRLRMIPYLSPEKRREITSFSAAGLDQARSEIRQVWLTLRYHLHATKTWALALRTGSGRGESAWTATLLVLKWLLPIGAFVWWRRRAQRLLSEWRAAIIEDDRKKYGAAGIPSLPARALSVLMRVRRPLEWLLLLWAVLSLLPESMRTVLEVELVATVFSWTLGGALVVNTIDALRSDDVRGPHPASAQGAAHLRLRSLRLIGFAVVSFGLILALSAKLVGEGTIYRWVFSTCWFAAIPLLLIIVTWWKPVIFERIDLTRKKGKFERWVLANKTGINGFAAAIAAGVQLFAKGVWRILHGWVVKFTVVRKLLAYLFLRGMSKKAADQVKVQYGPIDSELFGLLGPETPSSEAVPSVADADLEEVIQRIESRGGGMFAIVGERGAGKTTLIERIAATSDELVRVACPLGGITAFKKALNGSLGFEEHTELRIAASRLDSKVTDSAILIDDAHRLIVPMMGGLTDFDQVLELARNYSKNCAWIFTIDQALWRFLERARGAKPLFDDIISLAPWSEEGIVRLLRHRNERAKINPDFAEVVTELPGDADEIDIVEAIQRTEVSFYRLLWDYASGNPGVALHFWRQSLGVDPEGRVCVRPFKAPDPVELEDLPDSTVFVLRAAVQLESASLEQLCQATALPLGEVQDALRYGSVKGFFEGDGDRVFISWNWFPAITRLLRRRHLLFAH